MRGAAQRPDRVGRKPVAGSADGAQSNYRVVNYSVVNYRVANYRVTNYRVTNYRVTNYRVN